MNWVFYFLIAIAYGATVWQQWQWSMTDPALSPMHSLTEHLLHASNDAVTLVIGLIGVLAFFMGLMRIIEEAGILHFLAKLIYPLLKWLFPEIPANHPAFGAMVMNLSANVLGLGNAATPFGLKTMQELDKLNPHPGTATNAMVLFLAINTSSVTLLPTKVISLRVSAGSHDPAGIIATTLIATLFSTFIAIVAAKVLQKMVSTPTPTREVVSTENANAIDIQPFPAWCSTLALLMLLAMIPIVLLWGKLLSPWIIPSLIVAIVSYGMYKKVDIYISFTEGAKAGFDIAVKILPYLLAILVAIAMFRTSGALEATTHWLGNFTSRFGLPGEALPMVFMRPLSGTGSLGLLSDVLNNPAIGPDSYTGYLVSTMAGCTETTFYILAVYFGAIQIKRIRHALAAGLLADLAGMTASIFAVKFLLFS